MTKKELIENVANSTNMTKKDVTNVIEVMLVEIKDVVKNDEKLNLVGFGNFEKKINKAREGINPATKEKIKIAESRSIKFKVSKTFKEYLN